MNMDFHLAEEFPDFVGFSLCDINAVTMVPFLTLITSTESIISMTIALIVLAIL